MSMPGLSQRKDDGRWLIQWFDADGRQRQETLPDRTKDGKPLTIRAIEAEAMRRLTEYREAARRQRHGLDAAPVATRMTFGQLRAWWWEQKGKTLRSTMVGPFLNKHLRELDALPLRSVTSVRIQRLLADKVETLAPKSRNDLRSFLFNIFSVASAPGGPWAGRVNPVAAVPRAKVARKPRRVLELAEFEPVLAEVPPEWQGVVATGLYAGLREGEIFGLLKQDVDLQRGTIMVWRSWDAPRTKDGKALPMPIADALLPRLEKAMREAPGRLVFPTPDGSMHSRKLRLNRMLRAAVARAGLLDGYEHRCRAARCGWRKASAAAVQPSRCPKCGSTLTWSKPLPRHVTFHGTRHSFGTQVVRVAGTGSRPEAAPPQRRPADDSHLRPPGRRRHAERADPGVHHCATTADGGRRRAKSSEGMDEKP